MNMLQISSFPFSINAFLSIDYHEKKNKITKINFHAMFQYISLPIRKKRGWYHFEKILTQFISSRVNLKGSIR